jgi:hypothetical protein
LRTAKPWQIETLRQTVKEGLVSLGQEPGLVKVKTATWRAANRNRWEMFETACQCFKATPRRNVRC